MPVKLTPDSQFADVESSNGSLLGSTNKKRTSHLTSAEALDVLAQPAPSDFINGLIVNRDTIKAMAQKYRANHNTDPNCLKFIHFSLKEVIQLFIDNEVIDSTKTIDAQMNGLQFFGFKIYLGNHVDLLTCPPSAIIPNPYLGMDTAIICNTQLDVASKTWKDQLKPGTSVTILGAGEGLDRGSICPPNCVGVKDPDDYFQEDILP
ncbi:hypothetical protein [Mucilaginibacter sp. OK098]|uniref:hypothetical protein n=1 Tax=Mucilaginibacter sp. OK098 TaxID=1855297 RepID=UPI00091B5400|nr:hypothetical protein [Mucilaginibacter sp. OK098]SHN07388.1 hypothetical protein SAMN05216524_10536 [Mucilaginibacter sp. OK098]